MSICVQTDLHMNHMSWDSLHSAQLGQFMSVWDFLVYRVLSRVFSKLSPNTCLWRAHSRYYCLHYVDKNRDPERGKDFARLYWLVSGGAGTDFFLQTYFVTLFRSYFSLWHLHATVLTLCQAEGWVSSRCRNRFALFTLSLYFIGPTELKKKIKEPYILGKSMFCPLHGRLVMTAYGCWSGDG